jgi:hypothetical protein
VKALYQARPSNSPESQVIEEKTIVDRHFLKTTNLKSGKPFGFRNGITISD